MARPLLQITSRFRALAHSDLKYRGIGRMFWRRGPAFAQNSLAVHALRHLCCATPTAPAGRWPRRRTPYSLVDGPGALLKLRLRLHLDPQHAVPVASQTPAYAHCNAYRTPPFASITTLPLASNCDSTECTACSSAD